jgi:outer membrane receptor protein involved in Fe transport
VLTPDFDPYDLDHIEVLRGPQGTLYGSNTLGGLIKFVTAAPDTTSLLARVSVDASHLTGSGNGTGVDTHAMVNAPLIQNVLGLRVSAYERTDPGYINNVLTGGTDVNKAGVRGGRVQLLWTPNEDLSVRLSAIGQDLRSNGLANGGVDMSPTTLQPIEGQDRQVRAATTGRFDVQYRLFSATVSDDFHFAKLVSTTAYSTLRMNEDVDATAAYGAALGGLGVSVVQPISLDKITEELRLESPEEQLIAWRVGFFFNRESSVDHEGLTTFDETAGTPVDLSAALGGPPLDLSMNAVFREWAGYVDATLHATSRLAITAGARYSDDHTTFKQDQVSALLGNLNLVTPAAKHPVTFLFNPSYKLTDTVMPYVRIASGFRPGGPNVGVPAGFGAPTTFDPDKLISYEAGVKSTINNQLSVDVSAYYIDWSHVQLTTFNAGYSYLGNGGKASSRGLELGIRYAPVRGLSIYANAAYTNAHLDQDTPFGGIYGLAGDSLPWIPKFAGSVGAEQKFTLVPGWDAFAGANYSYTGGRRSDFMPQPFDNPQLQFGSYNNVDLYAGIKHSLWTIQLYAKNLVNSRGVLSTSAETQDPVAGAYNTVYQPPRVVGVSASVGF